MMLTPAMTEHLSNAWTNGLLRMLNGSSCMGDWRLVPVWTVWVTHRTGDNWRAPTNTAID